MKKTTELCLIAIPVLLSAAALVYYSTYYTLPPGRPVQVVYRFDDHRYLELKGWNCEGELWYTDTQRKIHSQVYSQFYRIFTGKYIHPSERYIAILHWSVGGATVSRDYGRTWNFGFGHYAAGLKDGPRQSEGVSFTVVNDQGFMLDDKGQLFFSSKPFEDPRVLPGGPGITYHLSDGYTDTIDPDSSGNRWGLEYTSFKKLKHDINHYKINFQNIPDKVPEVKNYTGWDHMVCDWNAGREQKK